MAKTFFTIARSDKKTRKKAIELLDKEENIIDAFEVFGGRKDDDTFENSNWIEDNASFELKSGFNDSNAIL
jgi:hypothetical protein